MLGIILEGIDFFPDSQMQIKLPKQSNKYFYFDLVFFLLKIYFRTLTIRAGYLLKKAPCNLHRGSSSNKTDQLISCFNLSCSSGDGDDGAYDDDVDATSFPARLPPASSPFPRVPRNYLFSSIG